MPRPSRFVARAKHGRLKALARSDQGRALYLCDCGTLKDILIGHVLAGKIQSCGCLHKERTSARLSKQQTTHGRFGSPIYAVWNSMKQRCTNPAHRAYPDYGGRGITVCERWTAFGNFLEDMGERPPGMTLERKNNSLGYSKENCVWADWSTQANNTRSCVVMSYQGLSLNVTQWAVRLNVPRQLIYRRLRASWSVERTLTTPIRGSA